MFSIFRQLANKTSKTNFNSRFSRYFSSNSCPNPEQNTRQAGADVPEVPWFPTTLRDLDKLGNSLQKVDEEISKDHPGFKDRKYKERRNMIAKLSQGYKMETPIPYFNYSSVENKTWEHVYKILRPLQEKYMCESFNNSLEKMRQAGILKAHKIPQLQDVSDFLIKETNFRLKPIPGILSQREFLNSLALRTFCCTQYIRHHSAPEYTPEPDIVHELLGHAAMFADPDFCDLSQEIGLLSLGNTEENIKKLGALYWYTVEFGACKEGNGVKAYGAGIASSIGEILNFGEGRAELRTLNPDKELDLGFPVQTFQPIYYVAESFKEAGDTLIRFGENLPKPFKASFNHTTNSVEVNRGVKLVHVEEKVMEFM